MRVALVKYEIIFPYCHSLKEKRHNLHKIKGRIFADFKISLHEVSHHDKWQRAQLGMAIVGNDAQVLQGVVDDVTRVMMESGVGEMVDQYSEIVTF